MLLTAVKRLIPFEITMQNLLINCCCRCMHRHRGYPKVQQLVDVKTAQLDIRSLVNNSIALQDFFRCFLTP